MICTAAVLCLLGPLPPLRILFFGNSHTSYNDIPNQVRQIIQSAQPGRKVTVQFGGFGHLNDLAKNPANLQLIERGKWDIVLLQAAMVSSSHKYRYKQDGGILMAQAAVKAKAKTYLWVEWPRRGWDESEFTLNEYRVIAKAVPGTKIIPVCTKFDAFRAKFPGEDMWASDGNHANEKGSHFAACVIANTLLGGKAAWSWQPKGIEEFAVKVREFLNRS